MLRWPEMRYGDLEGVGSRGKHGETRLVAANSGATSTLAGGPPDDGAVKIRCARGGFLSGELGFGVILRDRSGEEHG